VLTCRVGIAWPDRLVKLKKAENDEFSFQKVFNDGEFLAAGILEIPPNGMKPSRSTKDNTYASHRLYDIGFC
jgi:centromere protein C